METNEEVDQAADLLRAIGLEVNGEDGYVEVEGPDLNFSIMLGTMIDVPRHGGTLLQITIEDVAATAEAAKQKGGVVARGPDSSDDGGASAFVQSPTGFTIELQSAARAGRQER